jgi:hypothetical protein
MEIFHRASTTNQSIIYQIFIRIGLNTQTVTVIMTPNYQFGDMQEKLIQIST